MTKYLDLKKDYQKEDLTLAAENIKEGNLVLFPTETVYGIGANGLNSDAVKKIFIAKGRASDNPLILHVSSIKMVDSIAKDITPLERQLMEAFFPGPLTIILKRKDNVPDIVTASLDIGTVIMEMSSLSFLGLSSPLPTPEWGAMISEGKSVIQFAPWTLLAPGLAILIVVVLFNLLGDIIRDLLDLKEKERFASR